MTANLKNEKLKRSFIRWLREAKGFAEATVTAGERALSRWEEFFDFEDFGRFTANKAINFKNHLEHPVGLGKPLSANSRHHCLRRLCLFFQWLSTQPGYKTRITAEAISYLSLDKKTLQAISWPRQKKHPTLDYVRKLVESIQITTEIDRRDRALIAFLLLSGMRDKAVVSLPLGCFDPDTLEIRQYPKDGVDTKFGKSFVTLLVRFDNYLLGRVTDWVRYIREVKLFGSTDPVFPRNKVTQANGGYTFVSQEVEPVFWRSTGSIRRVLKERTDAAGLPYYFPHSFRHAHVRLALKHCQTAEQMKAISQNLGHENVGTTLTSYGTLDQYRIAEVIRSMDFKEVASGELSPEELEVLEKVLRRHRKMT